MYLAILESTQGNHSLSLRVTLTLPELSSLTKLKHLPKWLRFDITTLDKGKKLRLSFSRDGKNKVSCTKSGASPTCAKALGPLGLDLKVHRTSLPVDWCSQAVEGATFDNAIITIPSELLNPVYEEQLDLRIPETSLSLEIKDALADLNNAIKRADREGYKVRMLDHFDGKVRLCLESKTTLAFGYPDGKPPFLT